MKTGLLRKMRNRVILVNGYFFISYMSTAKTLLSYYRFCREISLLNARAVCRKKSREDLISLRRIKPKNIKRSYLLKDLMLMLKNLKKSKKSLND